jgi:hypothetical protein
MENYQASGRIVCCSVKTTKCTKMKQKYLVAQYVQKEFRLIQSKQCFSVWKCVFIIVKTLGLDRYISVGRYIRPITIYRYRQTGYRYRPYRYWLLWISVILVSAKYRLKYMDIGQNIGQNTSYQPNIGQNENIGIGGRYVSANKSVSERISAGRIYLYRYRYRLDSYQSNFNFLNFFWRKIPL